MVFNNPQQSLQIIAEKARDRRIDHGLTQKGLALRAGVSLAVLRKFEQTGNISLISLLKLAVVLDAIEDITQVFDQKTSAYRSIDEVLKQTKPKRKRGWRT